LLVGIVIIALGARFCLAPCHQLEITSNSVVGGSIYNFLLRHFENTDSVIHFLYHLVVSMAVDFLVVLFRFSRKVFATTSNVKINIESFVVRTIVGAKVLSL
jgi:hypothetical protein